MYPRIFAPQNINPMKNQRIFGMLIAALGIFSCSHAQIPYPSVEYATPAGKTLHVYMIHHGSLAIMYEDFVIQIDPVGNDGGKKIDYSRFPKADVILVSHEHFDHCDKNIISQLTKEGTAIFANQASSEKLPSCEVLKNGDQRQLNAAVALQAVPAYNTTPAHAKFHPKGNGNGFLLNFDGFVVYVSGDTESIEEMKTLGSVDVAFLSTNQPYTMTPEQCIEAAQMINPKVLIPYHLGNTKTESIQKAFANSNVVVRIFETLR